MPYMDAFCSWLEGNRHARATIEDHRQVLVHFDEYLSDHGVDDVRDIRLHHAEGFARAKERRYLETFGRPASPPYLQKFHRGARLFVDFLQASGIIPLPPPPAPPQGPFVGCQQTHLADLERKGHLQPSTLKIRRSWVGRFCDFLYGRGIISLRELTPVLLYDFLNVAAENKATGTLHGLNAALRDFLRFAFASSWTSKDFSPYLPRVHTYRDQRLPRYLSREQLQDILANIDIHRRGGFKLKAILTLLASYGLRIEEVAKLTLAQVNWSHRQVSLPERKADEPLLLPLTPEAATALANYILHERPRQIDSPYIFLTGQRPRPYCTGHLGITVNQQLRRLKLKVTTRTFRYTFAKQLIDQRVPLKAIQELMGHRCIESTRIYARIDVEALREVAENDSLDL